MSGVRWCDRHNGPFSVLEDGWETYTATRTNRNPVTGRTERETYQADSCGPCSAVNSPIARAAIAAGTQDAPVTHD